jgi:hypothetical protein
LKKSCGLQPAKHISSIMIKNKTMPKKVLRQQPPLELLNEFLAACGLDKGVQDPKPFTKSGISIATVENLLPQLEPYYLPCLAPEYLHITPLTPSRAITILRHILQAHSIQLYSMERTVVGVRGVCYHLQKNPASLEGDIQVDFT